MQSKLIQNYFENFYFYVLVTDYVNVYFMTLNKMASRKGKKLILKKNIMLS